MTQEHLITPPSELVLQWTKGWTRSSDLAVLQSIATQAARWGADQQLEECERYWMTHGISPEGVVRMREHLRPKPLSLKELNLKHLEVMERDGHYLPEIIADLRRAIESLTD
jgi:hypothetical protein